MSTREMRVDAAMISIWLTDFELKLPIALTWLNFLLERLIFMYHVWKSLFLQCINFCICFLRFIKESFTMFLMLLLWPVHGFTTHIFLYEACKCFPSPSPAGRVYSGLWGIIGWKTLSGEREGRSWQFGPRVLFIYFFQSKGNIEGNRQSCWWGFLICVLEDY